VKKFLVILILSISSINVFAQDIGRVTAAIPTIINTVRGDGMMIYGAFENPGSCDIANAVWVDRTHPEYQQLYSTALAAFMGGKKLDMFIHSCTSVPWIAGDKTFNKLNTVGDFRIRN